MGLLGLKTFRHGIHPPESKDDTSGLPIRQFPFAPLLIIPLGQHIGKPSVLEVQEGQEVTRGQRLARADGFVSVSMHAPASGTIRSSAWKAPLPRAGFDREEALTDGSGYRIS